MIIFLLFLFLGQDSLLILKSGTQLECEYYTIHDEWVIVQLKEGFKLKSWKGSTKFKIRQEKVDWAETKARALSIPNPIKTEKSETIQKEEVDVPHVEKTDPSHTQKEGGSISEKPTQSTKPSVVTKTESTDNKPNRKNAGEFESEGSFPLSFEVEGWVALNDFKSVSVLRHSDASVKVLVQGQFNGPEKATYQFDLTLKNGDDIVGQHDFSLEVIPGEDFESEFWIPCSVYPEKTYAFISLKHFF